MLQGQPQEAALLTDGGQTLLLEDTWEPGRQHHEEQVEEQGSQKAPESEGTVKHKAADPGEVAAGDAPLTFVRLGRRAWKGSQGHLPRQGISILPGPFLRGPTATTLLCCGSKVSWPGCLPRPWAPIWQGKETDEA